MLISNNQDMEADSCQAASNSSVPSLPQGITYWDPYLGTVVHRTSDGLIKANTTAGPQGFLVGSFEGFKAQPFVTEVPNLALEKTKTNRKQVELPLGQEKEHNETKQKGQFLKEMGRRRGSARANAKRRRGRGRGNKNLPLALFASPRPQISGTSLQRMSRASLYMWSMSTRRIAHAMPP